MRVQLVDPAAYTLPYDHALAGALSREGVEVELVTSRFVHGEVPRTGKYEVRATELFYRRATEPGRGERLRRALRAAEHVPGMLRYRRHAREADLVHYQWLPLPSLDRRLLAPSRPRLYTMHWRLPPAESRIGRSLAKLLAEMDAVVVHSRHGAGRLEHDFGVSPERLEVIAHGAFDYLTRQDEEAPLTKAREQLVRRFEREAQVTAALRSPHTVQLYDFGVNDTGSFYYVMEFLNGLDLHHIVTRFGPQPAERVVMLLRQACRSLAEAHERGLVHRDIKPANVFVTRLGTEYDYVKILDFGVVKDQSGRDATMLSNQSVVQGTPAFMPPEIVLGEGPIDGRADLYSLACTAYWALTAQTVFDATNAAQMLLQHVRAQPVLPSMRSELSIPEQFEAILMRCLEKDPAKRPSSAVELDSELAHVRCDTTWTNERAQKWWNDHVPEVVGT
jgi:serine/threonine protein kinase